MKPIEFKGCNVRLGKQQAQFRTLPAIQIPSSNGQHITCWELSKEDIAEINRTGVIYASQLTYGYPFQPMNISSKLEEIGE